LNEMLKPVMVVSNVLGVVLIVVAAGLKAAMITAGIGPGYQAGNWGIGVCALFLCSLASARMIETGRK
jgi:hypothetical protein